MSTATKFWTWAELWAVISDECDVADEDFVDKDECREVVNRAIDEAEALIQNMYQGYFLAKDDITLVSGTDEYELPADVYAHKLVDLIYKNGTTVYRVERVTSLDKFIQYRVAIANGLTSTTDRMRYFVVNNVSGEPRVLFTPPVSESGQYVEVWYYRNANRLTEDGSVCDIPEFANFVLSRGKEYVMWKAGAGSARHQAAVAESQRWRDDMIVTLREMVADGSTNIEEDTSHYEEHV